MNFSVLCTCFLTLAIVSTSNEISDMKLQIILPNISLESHLRIGEKTSSAHHSLDGYCGNT